MQSPDDSQNSHEGWKRYFSSSLPWWFIFIGGVLFRYPDTESWRTLRPEGVLDLFPDWRASGFNGSVNWFWFLIPSCSLWSLAGVILLLRMVAPLPATVWDFARYIGWRPSADAKSPPSNEDSSPNTPGSLTRIVQSLQSGLLVLVTSITLLAMSYLLMRGVHVLRSVRIDGVSAEFLYYDWPHTASLVLLPLLLCGAYQHLFLVPVNSLEKRVVSSCILAAMCFALTMPALLLPWQRNLQFTCDLLRPSQVTAPVVSLTYCRQMCRMYSIEPFIHGDVPGKPKSNVKTEEIPLTLAFGPSRKGTGGSWRKFQGLDWIYSLYVGLQLAVPPQRDAAAPSASSDTSYHERLNTRTVISQYGLSPGRLAAIFTGRIQVGTLAVFWIAYWLMLMEITRLKRHLQLSTPSMLPIFSKMILDAAPHRTTETSTPSETEFQFILVPGRRRTPTQRPTTLPATSWLDELRTVLQQVDDRGGDIVPYELSADIFERALEAKLDGTNGFHSQLGTTRIRSELGRPLTAGEVARRVLHAAASGARVTEQRDTLCRYLDEVQRLTECNLQYSRYLVWLLPCLGFIGTLVGISGAFENARGMAGLSDADRNQKVDAILANLGTAFDTTLVALLASTIIAGLIYYAQTLDMRLCDAISSYITTNILGKQNPSDTSSPPVVDA